MALESLLIQPDPRESMTPADLAGLSQRLAELRGRGPDDSHVQCVDAFLDPIGEIPVD